MVRSHTIECDSARIDVKPSEGGEIGMYYTAIALAMLGVAVGVTFRLKILLAIVALMLLISVVFSLANGFSFLDTALTIMAVQTILQGSYFLGLVARTVWAETHRMRHSL
jgi:hypothetical protein